MEKKKLKNPWKGLEGYDCFGCSATNPLGVKMEFYEEGDEVVSYWNPGAHYQGFLNTLHGGIQALLLDETCGWCVFRKLQTAGVTSKMEIKYLRPVSILDGELVIRASIADQKRNIVFLKAAIHNAAGEICTAAECTFFSYSKEKSIEEFHFRGMEAEE